MLLLFYFVSFELQGGTTAGVIAGVEWAMNDADNALLSGLEFMVQTVC